MDMLDSENHSKIASFSESSPITLHIQSLALDVVIGILPHEREKPQKVLLDLTITYPYTPHLGFLNYARVCEILAHELANKGYELLETALLDLSQILKSHFPQILSLTLKITKPHILAPTIVGASLTREF